MSRPRFAPLALLLAALVLAPAPAARAQAPDMDDISGTWRFSRQGDHRTCQVELTETKLPFGGLEAKRASGLDCNALGLFHLRRWDLVGFEVVLVDAFNKEIARLRVVGPDLLRGGGATMQR